MFLLVFLYCLILVVGCLLFFGYGSCVFVLCGVCLSFWLVLFLCCMFDLYLVGKWCIFGWGGGDFEGIDGGVWLCWCWLLFLFLLMLCVFWWFFWF